MVKGKCNSELLAYKCFDIEPIAAEFIRKFKGGKRICGRRDKEFSYMN